MRTRHILVLLSLLSLLFPATLLAESQPQPDSTAPAPEVVMVSDVGVVQSATGTTIHFTLTGVNGGSAWVNYGIVAQSEGGEVVDFREILRDVTLKEGEPVPVEFLYSPSPYIPKGRSTVSLVVENRNGFRLATEKLFERDFPGVANSAISCIPQEGEEVPTCFATKATSVDIAYHPYTPLGQMAFGERITLPRGRGVSLAIPSQLTPGTYIALVRDMDRRLVTSFPVDIPGTYGKIRNISLDNFSGDTHHATAALDLRGVSGASLEAVAVSVPEKKTCAQARIPVTGDTAAFSFTARDCAGGMLSIILRDGESNVLDVYEAPFAVLTPAEQAERTQEQRTRSAFLLLLTLLLVVALAIAALLYLQHTKGKIGTVLPVIITIALSVTFAGWGIDAKAQTCEFACGFVLPYKSSPTADIIDFNCPAGQRIRATNGTWPSGTNCDGVFQLTPNGGALTCFSDASCPIPPPPGPVGSCALSGPSEWTVDMCVGNAICQGINSELTPVRNAITGQTEWWQTTNPGCNGILCSGRITMYYQTGGLPSCGVSCPATAINNCVLMATPHDGTSGSCSGGYTNTCNYRCNNGTWQMVSNSCVPTAPTIPTNLSATPGACGAGTIIVNWDAVPGATGYELRDGATTIYDGPGTSFTHSPLILGSGHSYTVRAKNTSGSSGWSGAVNASAPSACGCPGPVAPASQNVIADAGGGMVWGSGPFTTDSSLATIARFLGAQQGVNAALTITPAGCVSSYTGSTQNTVTTLSLLSPYQGMNVSCTSGCVVANIPPIVDAGPNIAIALNGSVTISGASASDPDGSVSSLLWTFRSGPATPVIVNNTTLTPDFSGFTSTGVYVFRLTATDNLGATAFDEMDVTVAAPGTCPGATISNCQLPAGVAFGVSSPGSCVNGYTIGACNYTCNAGSWGAPFTNTCRLPQCSDGVDNADPEDTLVDMADPGCSAPGDDDETNIASASCGNNLREGTEMCDGSWTPPGGAPTCAMLGFAGGGTPTCNATCDGYTGCIPGSTQCSDRIDNDGDGKIDYVPGIWMIGSMGDPGCTDFSDDDENDYVWVPGPNNCQGLDNFWSPDGFTNLGTYLMAFPSSCTFGCNVKSAYFCGYFDTRLAPTILANKMTWDCQDVGSGGSSCEIPRIPVGACYGEEGWWVVDGANSPYGDHTLFPAEIEGDPNYIPIYNRVTEFIGNPAYEWRTNDRPYSDPGNTTDRDRVCYNASGGPVCTSLGYWRNVGVANKILWPDPIIPPQCIGTVPVVTTNPPTSITQTSAVLSATAVPNGSSATGWFRYYLTDPGPSCVDTGGTRVPASGGFALGNGNSPVPFTQSITTFAPGSTYWVCAFARNDRGIGLGNKLSFSTLNVGMTPPTVTTMPATNITSSSVILNASVNPNGKSTDGRFRYSAASIATCDSAGWSTTPLTALGSGNTAQPLTYSLTGLTSDTTYYYCARAANVDGQVSGQIMTFKTLSNSPDLLPVNLSRTPTGSLTEGSLVTFSAQIRNQGAGSALATDMRFCIDNPNCATNTTGRLGADAAVIPAPLAAGATSNVVTRTWSAVAGTHTLYVCADVGGVITESNETNNCQSLGSITVTSAPATITITVTPTGGNVPSASPWSIDMTSTNADYCEYIRSGTYPGNWATYTLVPPFPHRSFSYSAPGGWVGPGNVTYTFRCLSLTGVWSAPVSATITIGAPVPQLRISSMPITLPNSTVGYNNPIPNAYQIENIGQPGSVLTIIGGLLGITSANPALIAPTACTAYVLTAGASAQCGVNFQPTVAGLNSTTFTFNSDGGNPTVTVVGTGVNPFDDAWDMGRVPVGRPRVKPFSITNDGPIAMPNTRIFVSGDYECSTTSATAGFGANCNVGNLNGGDLRDVWIRFTPTAVGPMNIDALVMADFYSNLPTIPITGTGILGDFQYCEPGDAGC